MAPQLPSVVPFPEGDAKKVKWAAGVFNYDAAAKAVDFVRDMIGHPQHVQRAVNSWVEAARTMQVSVNEVATAQSEVAPQWVGGAALAFSTYATNVQTRITANVTALTTAANNTVKLYEVLIDSYVDCIEFITDCAKAIFGLGGDVLSDVKLWVAGGAAATGVGAPAGLSIAAGHVVKALTDMTEAISKALQEALNRMKEQTSALASIRSSLATVAPPPGLSDRLRDPAAWKP